MDQPFSIKEAFASLIDNYMVKFGDEMLRTFSEIISREEDLKKKVNSVAFDAVSVETLPTDGIVGYDDELKYYEDGSRVVDPEAKLF